MKLPFDHITTPRLVLRPPEAGDWDAFRDFLVDNPRARFVGGGPKSDTTRRLAWRAFGHAVGHWVLKDYGPFIATDKTDGQPIGWIGPWNPEGWPEPEIAWSIWSDKHEGKGYAHEAAVAAIDWAYTNTNIDSFVSYVDHDNAPSAALAKRLGCVIDADAPRFEDEDDSYDVWRHPAPDTDGNPEAYA